MHFTLDPVATVKNSRIDSSDDYWDDVISDIELADNVPVEAFDRILDFSHLEIIYIFDKADPRQIVYSGRPRGNPDYPTVGIFAQRKKDRPNHLGLCTVELLEHSGRTIKVRHLDAINGTPVVDIKPVFREFQPQKTILQPAWVEDLMKDYWK